MTVLLRCRVEKEVLVMANEVTERLGTSTPEIVRIFLAEVARTGRVPVSLNTGADENIACHWEQRASTLESFYNPPQNLVSRRLAGKGDWDFNFTGGRQSDEA